MFNVIKAFTFCIDGIHPTEFGEGLHDLPERVAAVALAEGWAVEEKKPEAATVKPKRGRK